MSWLASLFGLFRRRRRVPPSLLSLDSVADRPAALDLAEAHEFDLEAPQLVEPGPAPETAVAPIASADLELHDPELLAFAPPEAYAPDAPSVELEEEDEARDFEEEADAQVDPLEDDAKGPSLDVRLLEALADIPERRTQAQILALTGVHRIALTDAAGPGSLAEALIALESEGRVICTVIDTCGEPCLQYEPVPAADRRSSLEAESASG